MAEVKDPGSQSVGANDDLIGKAGDIIARDEYDIKAVGVLPGTSAVYAPPASP